MGYFILVQRPFERYAATVCQYVHRILSVYLFYTILYIRLIYILWCPCETNSMGTYHTILHRLKIYWHVYFLLSKQTKYDQESNDGCGYTYTMYTTYVYYIYHVYVYTSICVYFYIIYLLYLDIQVSFQNKICLLPYLCVIFIKFEESKVQYVPYNYSTIYTIMERFKSTY